MTRKQKRLIVAIAAAQMIGSSIAAEPQENHMHHHHFPQDVAAFHNVLAPVWHTAPGKERTRNACIKADQMESLAKNIRSTDASLLLAGIAALKKNCDGKGDVDGALFDVHEAFHRLIEPRKGA